MRRRPRVATTDGCRNEANPPPAVPPLNSCYRDLGGVVAPPNVDGRNPNAASSAVRDGLRDRCPAGRYPVAVRGGRRHAWRDGDRDQDRQYHALQWTGLVVQPDRQDRD